MATIQERIAQLTRKTKAELVDLIVDDEAEVAEEPEAATEENPTEGMALVKVKGTVNEFVYAERVVTREAEVVDGEPTGGTLKTIVYNVYDSNGELIESLDQSDFYNKYKPVDHQAAKALTQEG